MTNNAKNIYDMDFRKSTNLQKEKPDLKILFCLNEFELNEKKIRKIDKKFHTFIHWYDENFRKLYKSTKNFNDFLKLRNSNDNNSILYVGIEDEVKKKYSKKINKYKKEYHDAFLTKIMIRGERSSRLLSLVCYNELKNKITIDKIIFHIYPIVIDDFHNK